MAVLDLIRQIIRESIKDAKVYYHGRAGRTNYGGSHIYLTDNPHYAMGYSDGKTIKAFRLKVPSASIFSISDPKHRALLAKHVFPEAMRSIVASAQDGEMDWSALSNIQNEDHDEPEELLAMLGFKGVFLHERQWADSLYLFDQRDAQFIKDIDITNPAIGAYRTKMDKSLMGTYNFL